MKRHYAAVSLILFVLTVAVAELSLSAKANGYIPTPANRIEIIEPRNQTYANSTVVLYFNVTEAHRTVIWVNDAFANCDFNYSIDNQGTQVVENLNITKEYDLNPYKNPYTPVADLVGSAVLSNLSDGWHNVTVYQIDQQFEKNQWHAQVINSETVSFKIDIAPPNAAPEPFPTILVFPASGALSAAVAAGAVIYWKKRKQGQSK